MDTGRFNIKEVVKRRELTGLVLKVRKGGIVFKSQDLSSKDLTVKASFRF